MLHNHENQLIKLVEDRTERERDGVFDQTLNAHLPGFGCSIMHFRDRAVVTHEMQFGGCQEACTSDVSRAVQVMPPEQAPSMLISLLPVIAVTTSTAS